MTSSTSCPSPRTPPALRPCPRRPRWVSQGLENLGEAAFSVFSFACQWQTFSLSLVGWESWSFWSGAEGAEGELAGHPACGRAGGLLQDPRPGGCGVQNVLLQYKQCRKQEKPSQDKSRLRSSLGQRPLHLLRLMQQQQGCSQSSGFTVVVQGSVLAWAGRQHRPLGTRLWYHDGKQLQWHRPVGAEPQ